MNTKVTVAIPCNRRVKPKTAECFMKLLAHGGYDFHVMVPSEGYTIAENRNYIAVKACNNKSDFLLMIDDDMTFEPDLLDQMVAQDKDILGVAYHPRSETGQIVKYLDETHVVRLESNTDPKYKKTFECMATGTGIILIKTSVFLNTPRPWFMFEYYPTGQCKLGEDWYFCREAKKVGYKVWADPTIKVGHLGQVNL